VTSSPKLAGEPPEAVALTMTAELSDEFRTKREGVGFVLDAVEAPSPGGGCWPSRPRARS
jgi:uncharacterized hydantoinase/oxoprolinase family protein